MLAGMTSTQITEWMAYAAVEPFGQERDDYRLAYGLAVIVNMFRGKEAKPVEVADLLPRVGILEHESASVADLPVHPNVRRIEEMMELWAQSQAS